VLPRGDEFRRGRRSRSADVGRGVGEHGVGGVADARYHRHGARGDGANDHFGVEAVQVLPRAAPARDQNHIRALRVRGEPAHGCGDLGRAVRALHGGRVDQQVHRRVAPPADLDNVAQYGPLQAGDDADAARKRRQRALVVEQAFAAQPGFQLLHGGQQGTQAGLLHGLGDELELPAGVVDRKLSAQPNGVAVLGPEPEQLRLAAKEYDRKLRFAVLQREIAVAARRWAPVGNLAFDRDLGVGAFDERAEGADELADREDVSCRRGCWRRSDGCGSGSGRRLEAAFLLSEDVRGGDLRWGVEEGGPGWPGWAARCFAA
jgi:hypothetical protein